MVLYFVLQVQLLTDRNGKITSIHGRAVRLSVLALVAGLRLCSRVMRREAFNNCVLSWIRGLAHDFDFENVLIFGFTYPPLADKYSPMLLTEIEAVS